jgi:RNA polymerase sigma factor (sigma-70 family)
LADIDHILEGCKSGDQRSQNNLVQMFAPKLLSICQRYTNDRDLAKDALQETFLSAFKYIHTYNGSGSFEGWLRRIAVNSSLKLIKSMNSRYFADESVIDTNAFAEVPDIYATLNKEEIMKLLNKLPHSQYVVFNLVVIDGLNHAEIAAMLSITESTSRATLCKARNKLVEIIKAEDPETYFKLNNQKVNGF